MGYPNHGTMGYPNHGTMGYPNHGTMDYPGNGMYGSLGSMFMAGTGCGWDNNNYPYGRQTSQSSTDEVMILKQMVFNLGNKVDQLLTKTHISKGEGDYNKENSGDSNKKR
jgi:hypothetical protein